MGYQPMFLNSNHGLLAHATENRMAWTIILLIFSNVFMTLAWYGHLKYEHTLPTDRFLCLSQMVTHSFYASTTCRSSPAHHAPATAWLKFDCTPNHVAQTAAAWRACCGVSNTCSRLL